MRSPRTSALRSREDGKVPIGEPGTVDIAAELTGLLPAQTYCVRVTAANSAGPAQPANEAFTTLAVAPTEAETAYAAPRTDTTARLNARVNPEGEAPLTYQFEYSEDGTHWTVLPERVSTFASGEQIVIADELEHLTPDTTYHYRLGLVKNEGKEGSGGEVPQGSLGEEKTFTTRTKAEAEAAGPSSCPNEGVRTAQKTTYLGFCRAIELVNNPDKGNQSVLSLSPQPAFGGREISPAGDRAVWAVKGGAPGSTSGVQSLFLARRSGPGACPAGSTTEQSETGWCSTSVIPPASKQLGGGSLTYEMEGPSPDLRTLWGFADASGTQGIHKTPWTPIRFDGLGGEHVFPTIGEGRAPGGLAGESEDGNHVLVNRHATESGPEGLEDFGTDPPQLISVMPDGSPAACGGTARGISAEGARVYFVAKPNKPAPNQGQCEGAAPQGLYLRDREAEGTTLIDPAIEGTRTTRDGRHAYFLTKSACRKWAQSAPTACDVLEPADANGALDLYRFDQQTGESSCLTCTPDRPAGDVAQMEVPEDPSHAYLTFAAGGGRYLLYVLSGDVRSGEGAAGTLRFIADPRRGKTSCRASAHRRRSQPTATCSSSSPGRTARSPPMSSAEEPTPSRSSTATTRRKRAWNACPAWRAARPPGGSGTSRRPPPSAKTRGCRATARRSRSRPKKRCCLSRTSTAARTCMSGVTGRCGWSPTVSVTIAARKARRRRSVSAPTARTSCSATAARA